MKLLIALKIKMMLKANKSIKTLDKKEESPQKWRLFLFYILSLIHLLMIFFIYYDLLFLLIVIAELLFFLYTSKFNIKILIRVLIIYLIFFILNVPFYDGKIVLYTKIFKITTNGLLIASTKIGFLLSIFLFSFNTFHTGQSLLKSKYFINKDNLLSESIKYFFMFLSSINKRTKLKHLIHNIIRVYKYGNLDSTTSEFGVFKIDKLFYIYNFCVYIVFIGLILFKILSNS